MILRVLSRRTASCEHNETAENFLFVSFAEVVLLRKTLPVLQTIIYPIKQKISHLSVHLRNRFVENENILKTSFVCNVAKTATLQVLANGGKNRFCLLKSLSIAYD